MTHHVGVSPAPSHPETELLLCCSRTQLDEPIVARICDLMRGGLDWDLLLRTAAPQGVTPLLYHALKSTCPDAVPDALFRDLGERFQSNLRRNLLLVRELSRLLALFAMDGIRVIPFKGPLLTAAAYRGNHALRHYYDLDLLVQPKDVPAAKHVLESQCYRPERLSTGESWEYHFLEPQRRWIVDLHQRIVPEYFPTVGGFEELWEKRRPVDLLGRSEPTLSPEDLLLVLSMQLAKDCREWKQRLVQICDAAELIRSTPGLDWDAVLCTARTHGAFRILLFNLHLANTLCGAPLPERIAAAVRWEPVVKVSGEVRARLFPEAEGPAEAMRYRNGGILKEDSRFHLRVRERWRDKLDYLLRLSRNHMRLIVSPTDRDRQFVSLPRSLGFLYYLVRPVRIGVHWFRTGQLKSPANVRAPIQPTPVRSPRGR